ncbi:hypothetical protein [Tardiphaga sp. 768_D3_N2_1]|uniref:hypothetical protein n=1 Tax=Tardiphaga sp. 768_D3_N2_1 TaxID=3240783 RepID=UPI003F8C7F61
MKVQAKTTRTHCKNGHPWTPDNIRPIKGRTTTVCVLCTRDSSKRLRASRVISRVRSPDQKLREYANRNKYGTLLKHGEKHIDSRSPTLVEWQTGIKRVCLHGHPLECEADFQLQKRSPVLLCRKCRATTAKRCKVNANFSEQTIRRIVTLIVDFGFTKHNLTGRRGQGYDGKPNPLFDIKGVTDITRFNNWLRKNPKMAKMLEPHLEKNRLANTADGMAKRRKDKMRISANSNAIDIISLALPKWLDRDQRSDVTTAMYLALADGHLKKKDIKARVGEFVRENSKLSQNIGRYGFNSLDAPMGDDNPASRIERLTDADRLWQSA